MNVDYRTTIFRDEGGRLRMVREYRIRENQWEPLGTYTTRGIEDKLNAFKEGVTLR